MQDPSAIRREINKNCLLLTCIGILLVMALLFFISPLQPIEWVERVTGLTDESGFSIKTFIAYLAPYSPLVLIPLAASLFDKTQKLQAELDALENRDYL